MSFKIAVELLLILSMLIGTLPPSAYAAPITISFIENASVETRVFGLPPCGAPPCLAGPLVNGPEFANVDLRVPVGFFPGIGAAAAILRAALIEPPTEPNPRAVSDTVEITILSATPGATDRRTFVSFRSDPDLPSFVIPAGFAVEENGALQDLRLNFWNASTLRPTPFPEFFSIEAQSDISVVPEPTTLLLFGTTMAGLGLAARWRRRRQN